MGSHLRRNSVAFAALFVALGGTSFALTTRGGETIHGCVSKSSGALRIASKCHKRSERGISWNEHGPAGVTGGTGATGPTGASGPASVALNHFSTVNPVGTKLGLSMQTVTSVSVSPSDGELLVVATATVSNRDTTYAPLVTCEVGEGSAASPGSLTVVAQGQTSLAINGSAGGFAQTIPVVAEFKPTASDRLVLACDADDPTAGADTEIGPATLSAISVMPPS